MKKFVTLLSTGLLVLMLSTTTVLAAGNPDVYYTEKRSTDETYKVSVMTNGKTTDGVIEITYNADELVCEEADVVVSTKVDLYSVNVEDGTVKISYIAEKAIPAGNLVTVSFDVTEQYLEQEVTAEVSGVSYDAKGKELSIGERVETPNSGKHDETSDNHNNSNNNKSSNQGKPENQPTVDDNQKPAENQTKPSGKNDKNESGKRDTASQEEAVVEDVQTEETQPAETESEKVQTEDAKTEVIADEEVPLASEEVQTSNTPVLATVLVVICIAAVAVVFVVKKKGVK